MLPHRAGTHEPGSVVRLSMPGNYKMTPQTAGGPGVILFTHGSQFYGSFSYHVLILFLLRQSLPV